MTVSEARFVRPSPANQDWDQVPFWCNTVSTLPMFSSPMCGILLSVIVIAYIIQLEPQKKQTGSGELERGSSPKPG